MNIDTHTCNIIFVQMKKNGIVHEQNGGRLLEAKPSTRSWSLWLCDSLDVSLSFFLSYIKPLIVIVFMCPFIKFYLKKKKKSTFVKVICIIIIGSYLRKYDHKIQHNLFLLPMHKFYLIGRICPTIFVSLIDIFHSSSTYQLYAKPALKCCIYSPLICLSLFITNIKII